METETPSAGSDARVRWLLGALGVAVVALVAYQMWPAASATPATPSSNPTDGSGQSRGLARGRSTRPT